MKFARSHDGKDFVLYLVTPSGYAKIVVTLNECERMREALEQHLRANTPVVALIDPE